MRNKHQNNNHHPSSCPHRWNCGCLLCHGTPSPTSSFSALAVPCFPTLFSFPHLCLSGTFPLPSICFRKSCVPLTLVMSSAVYCSGSAAKPSENSYNQVCPVLVPSYRSQACSHPTAKILPATTQSLSICMLHFNFKSSKTNLNYEI